MNQSVNLAIFASGAGSNAEKIIRYFESSAFVTIRLILCNKKNAGVFQVAQNNHIESILINKEDFFHSGRYIALLKDAHIDLVILAGFLWKVPANLIQAYPERIINIHPALLPNYGGKGMYGHFVHEAVIAAGEKASGITIHLVDEEYDHGKHLFQAECPVEKTDTPDTLAQKIHRLEHRYFPITIENYISETFNK